ncbi:hypothetical protein SK128_018427, partial [Halocaridina rubra]
GPEVPPWTKLVDYLREEARLSGTKVLCREGGCGICTVVVTTPDQENPEKTKTFSTLSCQTLVYSCDGWNIETVENLGDRFQGYHPLQIALHGFAGTQCGYCSPGMIMTMYGQIQQGPLTVSQVEKSLDGNLCRCTGYRPILDAFKSLATDADQALKNKLIDIEEAYEGSCKTDGGRRCIDCNKTGSSCSQRKSHILKAVVTQPNPNLKLTISGVQWHQPNTVKGIFQVIRNLGPYEKYQLVVGNTGAGVFKNDGPYSAYISTRGVLDLYNVSVGTPLSLGANVSLARAIEVFHHKAEQSSDYAHLKEVAKHWEYVANVSVRNVGCWAGNLMLKHRHQGFQSDIFLTLLACNAQLTVGDAQDDTESALNMEEFLKSDMSKKVILSLTLPPMSVDMKLRTFKVTPRTVNAHAYVNACVRMQFSPTDKHKIVGKPLILLGGINPEFIHASQTEEYLTNKNLNILWTVQRAINLLGEEVNPDSNFEDASPEYRRSLSQSLLYKAIIGFLGDDVNPKFRSAGTNIERPISSGHQSYDMNEDMWPVGKAIPKLESATQISGEARYLDDIPSLPHELHAALVQTTVANAKIKSVDTSEALEIPGVVTWVSKEDIPGENSFVAKAKGYIPAIAGPDPVFVAERVKYAGQPIGLIVAKDRDTAVRAARLVVVEYEDVKKPVVALRYAVDAEQSMKITEDMKLGDCN